MKTINLNDNLVEWKIDGHLLQSSLNRNARSDLHLQARNLLRETFPTLKIFEECPIPINQGKTLFLDFFVLLRNLAVEIHGEQHYKFVPHFHHSLSTFLIQKQNDQLKKEWCEKNGFEIIILPYNEDINEWRKKLQ